MSSEHAIPPGPMATHSAPSLITGDLESDPESRKPWTLPGVVHCCEEHDREPCYTVRPEQRCAGCPLRTPMPTAAAVIDPSTSCTTTIGDGLLDRTVIDAAPINRDPLRSALDHIAKTARASRTQSRRCRWIQLRAEGALAGIPYNAGDFDLPKMAPNSAEKLFHKNRHLRVELAKLKEAAQALLHQIEIGTFQDEEGHHAQMLKPALDLAALLGAAGTGLKADLPHIELLEWISADKKPDAGISYLLEIRENSADTTVCDLGWWDDEIGLWIANESGGAIAGTVLRYSDPRGLGA